MPVAHMAYHGYLQCALPDGLGVVGAAVVVAAVVAVVGWVVTIWRGGVGGLGGFFTHCAPAVKCDTSLKQFVKYWLTENI